MAKKDTKFSSTDQPLRGRGKSFKNKLLDVIREEGMIGATPETTKEDAEKLYIAHFATRAFDCSDNNSSTIAKELLNKSYPALKSTLPAVSFDLPENATPIEKAEAILKAIADGHIPPDIGVMLIQAAKYTIDIAAGTDLKDRIERIEEALDERST